MIYTALEVLEAAGIEQPEEKIGKFGISIGGVTVNTPDHLINVQAETTVSVRVGREYFTAHLPERDEPSEAVQKARAAKSKQEAEPQEEE